MAKAKKIFSVFVVVLLLAIMPAVSYVYLMKGYEYRKAAILTQDDFGKIPNIYEYDAVRGTLPDSLRGSMTVVGWLDPSKPVTAKQYGGVLDSLYQQFAASPHLYFTTLVKADDPTATARDFAATYNLPDDPMISFLAADGEDFRQSGLDFRLPGLPGEAPLVALVDSSLTIVKHYDLTGRDNTVSLVELISLIIPLPEKADIVVKREREL